MGGVVGLGVSSAGFTGSRVGLESERMGHKRRKRAFGKMLALRWLWLEPTDIGRESWKVLSVVLYGEM